MGRGLREACRVAGGYDGDKALLWMSQHVKPKGSDPLREQVLRAKLANLEEDRRAKRIKRREMEGELVSREEVTAEFSELLAVFGAILDALPDDLAKEMPEEHRATATALASQTVNRALRQLAGWQFVGGNQ